MNLLGSFVIACSMYSQIPMPRVEWTGERMRYVMCFFPLIGVVIGAAELLLFRLLLRLGAGRFCFALCGAAVPLLITGGIHMDGFLDTTDARRSYGARERKLEILKDPHTGAFAIIGMSIYLLFYAAALSELTGRAVRLFFAVFVMERALSGLSVAAFPMAKKDGLAARFSQTALKRAVCGSMGAYLAVCCVWLLWFGKWAGFCCIAAAGMTFLFYYRTAVQEFGGITGDLAGWFLQCCERNAVMVLAACSLAGMT